MIFVTGPVFSGKREYLTRTLGLCAEECVFEAQKLAAACADDAELEALAKRLSRKAGVTASETGCGVVPMDGQARRQREAAGKLCQLLARNAEKTVRMWCGIAEELS